MEVGVHRKQKMTAVHSAPGRSLNGKLEQEHSRGKPSE